jgi:hypothetical protein
MNEKDKYIATGSALGLLAQPWSPLAWHLPERETTAWCDQ